MANSLAFGADRTTFRPNRQDPYLHLHFVIVFVRDQERSVRFYLDQLGFVLVVDHTFASGERLIEVAPPDGTAKLALVVPKPGSEEELIGRPNWIFFLTEDVDAKFEEWRARGVRFQFPQSSRRGVEGLLALKTWTGTHLALLDSTRQRGKLNS